MWTISVRLSDIVSALCPASDIDDIVRLAQERVKAGYDYVLCLIDMDVIEGNHEKMEHYRVLKKENPEIIFVESNPCTEYWFLMHFMSAPSSKEYTNYDVVAQALKHHIPSYDKTDVFFNKTISTGSCRKKEIWHVLSRCRVNLKD